MALGPKELALTMEEVRSADRVEEELDYGLMNNFNSGQKGSTVWLHAKPSDWVIAEVIRRYEAAGWSSVTWHERCGFVFTK